MSTLARIRSILRVVRLRPFDTETEAGRSAERYRRAVLTSASSLLARIATVGVALISVPLTVHHLGQERYGMWLTISSLIGFATVADLGVTQGLQTAIARTSGSDDRDAAREYVSTAAAVLAVTCTIGAVLLGLAYLVVPWPSLFNVVDPVAVAEAGPAACAFGVGWLINVALGLVTRTNDGYQDGLINNLWQIAGSGLSLAGVWLGVRHGAGLTALMLLFVGGPIVANLINGVVLFGWRRRWLVPRRSLVRRARVGELVGTGFWFLVAGVAYTALGLASTLVIAQVLGSSDVPELGVPARVAALGTLGLALLAGPLWSAFAEAGARGDHAWVRRAMGRATALAMTLGVVFAIGFALVGGPLVRWWVDEAVSPSRSMLLGLAVMTLALGVENTYAVFLGATGAVRFHAICWIVAVVLGLPAMVAAVHWGGPAGVPWSLAAIHTVCRLIPEVIYSRRLLAGATR